MGLLNHFRDESDLLKPEEDETGLLHHYKDDDDRSFGSMMFGPKMGSWSVSSKSDPRWNNNGRGYGYVCSGGPLEINKWIEECKKKFGEPPDDLYYSFWKD